MRLPVVKSIESAAKSTKRDGIEQPTKCNVYFFAALTALAELHCVYDNETYYIEIYMGRVVSVSKCQDFGLE